MSENSSPQTVEVNTAEPVTIEGPGRYRIFETPDGGYVIARAVNICEKCQDCGCGDQADSVILPPMVISLAKQMMANNGKGGFMSVLKGLRRG